MGPLIETSLIYTLRFGVPLNKQLLLWQAQAIHVLCDLTHNRQLVTTWHYLEKKKSPSSIRLHYFPHKITFNLCWYCSIVLQQCKLNYGVLFV